VEADWSVEIGAGLPVIEADWAGFVDLRKDMGAVDGIAEAATEPALRAALVALNGAGSPVFTSKCEVWELGPEEIDPLEFDCAAECGVGRASWVDVMARDAGMFGSFAEHEGWVRGIVARLQAERIGCGRVDAVVRSAVAGEREGFGITLYAAGCGVDAGTAREAWAVVLGASVLATMREVAPRF
jgi:hypothetical protein